MGKVFEYYVQIILEVFIIGLILSLAVSFGIKTREASLKRDNEMAVMHSLDEYRDLYMYDNKYISGDDVIRIMQYKKTMYDYWIDTDESSNINYMGDFTKPEDVFGASISISTNDASMIQKRGYCDAYRNIIIDKIGDSEDLNLWDISFLAEHFEIDRNGVYRAFLIRDEYPDLVMTEDMEKDNMDATRSVKGIRFERDVKFDEMKKNLR